ncbi:MAG: S-layer homology domain-containing protein [Clostridia bacterium]|nr:S-layer homology domain-containing protein [Clostridia bacterium]
MFKKVVAVLAAVVMLMSVVSVSAAKENIFPDVNENNFAWAADAINEMVELSIIKGYTDGTFKPERSITKAEALVLSARVLGYTDEANAPFAEFAEEFYADAIEEFDAKYPGEVAYLMYKDVLREKELASYIGGENANAPMKRYEAAVLLTKVLGAEGEIDDIDGTSTPYTDSNDIPSVAKAYVNYVTEIGLMQGMNKTDEVNEFAPLFEVNRAQMSMLLYRLMDIIDQEITVATLKSADEDDRTITYITEEGKTTSINIPYNIEPIVKKDGYVSKLSKLAPYSVLALVRRGGDLYAVETITVEGDDTFEGVLSSYSSKTATIKVYTLEDSSDIIEYPLAENVSIIREGNAATLTDLVKQDYVVLTITGGEVAVLEAYAKDENVRGTLTNIILEPEMALEVKLTNGDIYEYLVADEVTAKRNDKDVEFSDIKVGDKVNLTVRYGYVAVISATGVSDKISGTIDSITIATMPSIKIKPAGASSAQSYSLARDAEYVIDGEAGDIYSLRLGATVTVNIESDTVVKITSTTPSQSAAIVGVIDSVNKSYGFLTMKVTEADGSETSMQVFLKKSGIKIIDSESGKDVTSSALKAGQTISVTGAINTGAFEASTIIILP